jgi:quercetin dioxygenase-like cupin family protein
MAAKATGTVQEDNARTRVTLWSFAQGAETGHHRHEYDYVVVPLTSGSLTIVAKDGTVSTSELSAGGSYFRRAGVEHNVINASPGDFAFVEIEFK